MKIYLAFQNKKKFAFYAQNEVDAHIKIATYNKVYDCNYTIVETIPYVLAICELKNI